MSQDREGLETRVEDAIFLCDVIGGWLILGIGIVLTQNLCPSPPVGVFVPRLRRHPDRDEGDDQGRDVGQHVERVRHQGHWIGQMADNDFDEEKARREKKHRHQSTFFTRIPTHGGFCCRYKFVYKIQALLHNTTIVICCCCCLFLSKVFFGRFFVMMFMAASVTTATTIFPNALLLYRLLTSRLLQCCGEVMMRTDKQRIFLWFDGKRGGVFVFVVVVLSFLLLLHLQLDTKLKWSTNKGSI